MTRYRMGAHSIWIQWIWYWWNCKWQVSWLPRASTQYNNWCTLMSAFSKLQQLNCMHSCMHCTAPWVAYATQNGVQPVILFQCLVACLTRSSPMVWGLEGWMAISPVTNGRGRCQGAISASLGPGAQGTILLEDIPPSVCNSVHLGLHHVLWYLDVLASVHSEANLEGERRPDLSFTGYPSHYHDSGPERGVHHSGYLTGILSQPPVFPLVAFLILNKVLLVWEERQHLSLLWVLHPVEQLLDFLQTLLFWWLCSWSGHVSKLMNCTGGPRARYGGWAHWQHPAPLPETGFTCWDLGHPSAALSPLTPLSWCYKSEGKAFHISCWRLPEVQKPLTFSPSCKHNSVKIFWAQQCLWVTGQRECWQAQTPFNFLRHRFVKSFIVHGIKPENSKASNNTSDLSLG